MRWRRTKDAASAGLMRAAIATLNSLALAIVVGLALKSLPILGSRPLPELLLSSSWHPLKGEFGLYPFIISTFEVTGLAMAMAVPVCLLCAIYLSEYARSWVRGIMSPLIDVLAGIPSVIFGLWGVIVVVPAVRWLGKAFGVYTTGYSLLAGSVVLAIMVFPLIISVSLEVLRTVPAAARETAIALGATRWEAVKHVVFRSAFRGLLAAVVLGFSRALGETMAVLMVVGNVPKLPASLFSPAYPLPALIANNYGEMMSIPLYDSALMLTALVLLVVVVGFNLAAHFALARLEGRS